MAQFVSQRRHKIGVRMALGARPINVLRLVLGLGMRLALVGSGIGIAAAIGATCLIRSLLYDVTPSDPAAFIVVATLLIGVVFLACYIPARRAMRVDPMDALRYD